MNFRTDLALECREIYGDSRIDGVITQTYKKGNITVTRLKVTDEQGEKSLGKPMGDYITVEVPPFSKDAEIFDGRLNIVADELNNLLPEKGLILVVGLGNVAITPDALGPKTVEMILATRHISQELAKSIGFENLRPVAEIAPGVLGQTGIETSEIIAGIVKRIKPAAVIVIDALASRKLRRLGCTVQMSNVGVCPGSGVGNTRARIDKSTVGADVISVGVPTVVDGATLAYDLIENTNAQASEREMREMISPKGASMMVTPKEIDLLIERAARLVGMSINCALQPGINSEDMLSLVT